MPPVFRLHIGQHPRDKIAAARALVLAVDVLGQPIVHDVLARVLQRLQHVLV